MPNAADKTASPPQGMRFDPGTPTPKAPTATAPDVTPRLRRPERAQGQMRIASLDALLPPDHEVRVLWDYVAKVDVTPLLQQIKAVPGQVGRDATDPRLLLALWLYATSDGIGSARTLDTLGREQLAYQWLCGGVTLNYHTLADFRSQPFAFLDPLLTDSVATLLHENSIERKRVAQDGRRVRASAGASSFRREKSLQACLAEADAQVQALNNQRDEKPQAASRRQQAARERAARERQERLQQALAEREKVLTLRERQQQEKGVTFEAEALRASTTDCEARTMQFPDGGTRPGFNGQFATTPASGIVGGVAVTNVGSDGGPLQPMLEQIHERYDPLPEQALVDGGFTTLSDVEQAEANNVKVFGPIKNEASKQAQGDDPYQPHQNDGPGVSTWRQRMGTPEAQAIYRWRGQTAEWVNAGARNRGL